jgi:hypothetical protein
MSYVLPLKAPRPPSSELLDYLAATARRDGIAEVIVVDGSARDVFDDFDQRCDLAVRHVPVDSDVAGLANGKVAGVLTGVRLARHDYLVLADEDVRYDESSLRAVRRLLDHADLVAPQNHFDPMPWHACLDSARTLINRATGGDWPGTFGVRRSALLWTGGYDGDVLFENLELVRTLEAAGCRIVRPLDLFVARRPPDTHHFWSQRIRQAYDEFARPARLLVWLGILPGSLLLVRLFGASALGVAVIVCLAIAEFGRAIGAGRQVFPVAATMAAPLWLLERSVCAWLAVGARLVFGGVPYGGRILRRAATSTRVLRLRHATKRRGWPASRRTAADVV